MNKINIFKINDTYNILQKYKTKEEIGCVSAMCLGYDVVKIDGTFVKSFDDYDVAKKWIENGH